MRRILLNYAISIILIVQSVNTHEFIANREEELINRLSEIKSSKNEFSNLHRIVPKSKGRPLPQPQSYISTETQHTLDERAFHFQYATGSVACELLSSAFNRYYKIIFRPQEFTYAKGVSIKKLFKTHPKKANKTGDTTLLKRVIVNIRDPCEDYPSLESDESYTLQISADIASIESKTLWGTLKGLETFSQLVIEKNDGSFVINETTIKDFPRFKHRGVLLDTSRHYIDPKILKIHLVNIEAMAANKMNVFHWHIVDDESFPYQSITFPELSEKGAYDPYYHVYTPDVVQDIIEFARLRGIRVIPEFDSPGHSLSWGKAIPILTPCYTDGKPNGEFGPIDPTNNLTYTFWTSFIKELSTVFPDEYLHLGGDEVNFNCWKSNPEINKFMKKMGFGEDYSKLEEYYEQNLLNLVKQQSPKTHYIIWQEVITHRVKVKPETVVEIWKEPWTEVMSIVTALGHRTILSSCWYLNYIIYGSDWKKYYRCEPTEFLGTEKQKELVIGGEACMWGEYVDGSNVIQRTWPRASAVAERLWSAKNVTSIDDVAQRIEEQRCRMIRRGINAEPFDGSGFCTYEIDSSSTQNLV